jgi:hypothetical protein
MNIIELAKQAGLKRHQEPAPGIDGVVGNWADLEAFAELVRADEREACAKECERMMMYPNAKYGPMAFQIYLPTTPISSVNVNNWKLPWVYDQDRASGNVASMWVTPVAKLGISQKIKK